VTRPIGFVVALALLMALSAALGVLSLHTDPVGTLPGMAVTAVG
jgi:hypothetical protein